jgi:hypothetical protein
MLTLACLQDLSQARARWGAEADGLLSLFGTKVVLPGIADLATIELISRLGGEVDQPSWSTTGGQGWPRARPAPTVTWSTRRQRCLPVDAVSQLPAGSALVLAGSRRPERVRLVPWWATRPFATAARSPERPWGPPAGAAPVLGGPVVSRPAQGVEGSWP